MLKICDAHNDFLFKVKTKLDVEKYFKSLPKNIEKIFCAYFSYNNAKNVNVEDMKLKFSYLSNILAVKTVENCWFLDKTNIDKFVSARPFCATLSHNENNKLCGGAFGYGGLTNWGIDVVKIFQNNKIVVDTAHMNQKSFWEFIDLNEKPIMNSHTGFQSVFKHKRNISDSQIKEIIQSDGYIGLALYPDFFTNRQLSTTKLCEIICWFWDKFGTKTLGLGTDFNGIEKYPKDIKNYDDLKILEQELFKFGATKEDIENLFSENLLSFMKK